MNESQAKQFLINRIIFQAQKEHCALSEVEQYMLGWSESDKGFEIDDTLTERFNQETTDEAYEKKMADLIARAFKEDVNQNPEAKGKYRGAYRALKQGDHYILVMIEAAIGSKLKGGEYFERVITRGWCRSALCVLSV